MGTCHFTLFITHTIILKERRRERKRGRKKGGRWYMIPRINPKVKYRFWVMMMCHSRFINFNKCATLLGNVDNGGHYAIWDMKSLYLPLNFAIYLNPF